MSSLLELREVKSFWRRVLDAVIDGIGYTLGMWVLITVLYEPELSRHHQTDFLLWVGVVYATGRFVSRRDTLNFPGTQVKR